MTDASTDRETNDEAGGRPAPGTPRWVQVGVALAVAAVVLVVVLLLMGDGHGPSRHAPDGGAGAASQSPPVGAHPQP